MDTERVKAAISRSISTTSIVGIDADPSDLKALSLLCEDSATVRGDEGVEYIEYWGTDDEGDEPKAEMVDGKLHFNRAMANAINEESEEYHSHCSATFTITAPNLDGDFFKPQPSPKRKRGNNKDWWLRR